jgi:hypothetical protein
MYSLMRAGCVAQHREAHSLNVSVPTPDPIKRKGCVPDHPEIEPTSGGLVVTVKLL